MASAHTHHLSPVTVKLIMPCVFRIYAYPSRITTSQATTDSWMTVLRKMQHHPHTAIVWDGDASIKQIMQSCPQTTPFHDGLLNSADDTWLRAGKWNELPVISFSMGQSHSMIEYCKKLNKMKFQHAFVTQHANKMRNTNRSLKACHEIDQKWMSNSVCHFKDVSLWHQAVDLISTNDVTFLQSFYGKVFSRHFILCQQHLLHDMKHIITFNEHHGHCQKFCLASWLAGSVSFTK